jgi:hypothetical protein
MTENQRIPCSLCGKLSLKTIINANDGKCIGCVKSEEQNVLKKLSKVDQSWRVFNAPFILLRSKNRDYWESTLNMARAIAEVFTEEQLAKLDLVVRYQMKPEYFFIGISELTEIGQAFVETRFQNWFKNTDRWKSDYPPPIAKYKQSLQLQFQKFKKEQS